MFQREAFPYRTASLFPDHEIHYPTTSRMFAVPAAVVQDVLVRAASILKGISKDGHSVESTLFVDALSECEDS